MEAKTVPVVCVIPSLDPDGKIVQPVNGILRMGIGDLIIVDTLLFFASYQIQQHWVFRKEG